MSPSTNHRVATWLWRHKLDQFLGSKDASRGMNGSKPSPNHEGQVCRYGKASCQREKLGISGALSRKSLLEIRGRGLGKGF